MSSSGAARALARDQQINEFVYPESGSEAPTVGGIPGSGAPVQEQAAEMDSVPRVSEQEIARLIAEARVEGIREGQALAHKAFDEEIAQQGKRMTNALASFQGEREKYFAEAEQKLVELALSIAGKILHREAQVDRMVVGGLVKSLLERMQQGTKVTVRIRPEEIGPWKEYFAANADLDIVQDTSLKSGDCLLITELGTAEMGLDAQLKEVENGLFDLMTLRPASQ